jgi:UDP-N-acetylglucosamine 2-epimerase (non-hydrolysing)
MGNRHSGIMISIGTKAEFIKCMPLMLEMQKGNMGYWFLHTGQHSLKDSCEKFGVKRPDFVLSKPPAKSNTKFWSKINRASLLWFFRMIFRIREIVNRIGPKYVIYHGDTMSTAASSIASSRLLNRNKAWKNVHLEAGLRSGSLFEPFPEEISRRICDGFSDILLAVSSLTEENLKKESRFAERRIVKAGNTIVESALIAYEKGKKMHKKERYQYALINIHRHENLRSRKRMEDIVSMIEGIKINAIWPLHDNTRHYLEKYGLMGRLEKMKNLEITPLTDYPRFIFLLANSRFLVCDGGSIQEESLIFKKPCLILRKRTERLEGLETGINFMTMNVNKGKGAIMRMEKGMKAKDFRNPYGKRGISKGILEILR